jgi:nicotinamidase-related amidase
MKALIIVDMIHDFVDGKFGSKGAQEIIPQIKKLINWARLNKTPIIYLKDSHTPGDPELRVWGEHAMKGTWGSEIVEDLKPEKHDIVIPKKTYSGFFNTHLDSILRELEVSEVILTGVSTNICVQHTAADAFFRGYLVTVVSDATAAIDPSTHKNALDYMKLVYGADIKITDDIIGNSTA